MQRPTFKTCATKLLAIGLVCTGLFATTPRAQAADVSAIVSAALQIYGWLTKQFPSDVDPTRTEVLRNQELLQDLHLRFNMFENAIDEAIDTLDKLPDQYRDILRTMLDDMQGNRVLALVDEIVHDQAIIDQGKIPTIDPKERLHDLQVETGVLARRSDLNAPTLIVAYGYELSLMAALGAHAEEIEQKQSKYNERLLKILNVDSSSSLAHDYSVGIHTVEEEHTEVNWTADRNYYIEREKHLSGLCVDEDCSESYRDQLNICEWVSGRRLTDTGKSVSKSTDYLLQSLKDDEKQLLVMQQKLSILWSWEAILRSVAEVVPQELQEEKHRRFLGDSVSPEALDDKVRTARTEIADLSSSLQALRSTHLRQEHQFERTSPPTGQSCP